MIDIDTKKVVDILNSRDYQDVKEWLDSYPNIEVVSRDGSITYAKAIRDSHSLATQVSDRFHLLKNLTDYCKNYINRTVKHNIEIEVPTLNTIKTKDILSIKKKYQYQTKWELILAVRQLRSDRYTIDQICSILGLGNKSVIKYLKIEDSDKEKYDKKPIAKSLKEDRRKAKETLIQEVKLLKTKGYSDAAISRETGLDRRTIKKYVESDGTFVHASLGKTHKSKLDPYKQNIMNLVGYKGSDSLLRHFVSDIKKNSITPNNHEIQKVKRKNLITLLYKKIEDVKSISKEQLEKVILEYPNLKTIYQIAKDLNRCFFPKMLLSLMNG